MSFIGFVICCLLLEALIVLLFTMETTYGDEGGVWVGPGMGKKGWDGILVGVQCIKCKLDDGVDRIRVVGEAFSLKPFETWNS